MKKLKIIAVISIILSFSFVAQGTFPKGKARKVGVYCYNILTGLKAINNDANITATLSKDGGAPVAIGDINPVELGNTGYYFFDFNSTEADANHFVLFPVCADGNNQIDPLDVLTDCPPVNVWYVAKTGIDTDKGHSLAAAKLTISAAITAAAAGDKIIIYPGTYTEVININKDNMTLESEGWGTIITQATVATPTITVDDGTTLRNLYISHTGTPTGSGDCKAVYSSFKSKVKIENCCLVSTGRGASIGSSSETNITNCIINGSEYGIFADGSSSWWYPISITGCHISTSGWTSCSSAGIYCTAMTPLIKDCIIESLITTADGSHISQGIQFYSTAVSASKVNAIVENTVVIARSGNSAYEKGVVADGQYTYVNVKGGRIFVPSSSNSYVLQQLNSANLLINNCSYDSTKTSGTITDVSKQIADQTDKITDVNDNLLTYITDSNDNLITHINNIDNTAVITKINDVNDNLRAFISDVNDNLKTGIDAIPTKPSAPDGG